MDKDFVPADRKIQVRALPKTTQTQSDSGEGLHILVDMDSSEDHALTALCISYGTIRGMVSVEEFYKDDNTPV